MLNSWNPGAKGALQPDKEPSAAPVVIACPGGCTPHQGTLCMRLLLTQRSMVCIRALLAKDMFGGGGRTEMVHRFLDEDDDCCGENG